MDTSFTDFIEQVRSRNNIADVASKYMTLDKKGANYWACCPLHHETTPSFTVNPERGTYKCFGCGESGDVFKLVQELESCSFMDALKRLAERSGLPVPDFGKEGRDRESNSKKERLYSLMRETALHYHDNLNGRDGVSAMEYCKARGLSNVTIRNFGIGYSLGFDHVIKKLLSKGFTSKEIIEAGVAAEKNGKIYDALHGRLIIPILNNAGKVIAFGGRYIGNTDFAKYKNTSETIIFEKRKEIFGIHTLKRLKIESGLEGVIVVEGYMDVISLYQRGIRNVCASMGTALTPNQCKTIKFLTDKVYLCYDGDTPGQKATLKGIDVLKESGLETRVIVLQDKLDPDDFIKKYGKEEFEKKIRSAIAPTLYKINAIRAKYDMLDPDGKSKFAVESVKAIQELNNPIDRNVYLDYVAEYSGIDKSVLIEQMKLNESPLQNYVKKQTSVKYDNKYYTASRFILYSLYSGETYVDYNKLNSYYFDDALHKELFNAFMINKGNAEKVTIEDIAGILEDNKESEAIMNIGNTVADSAKAEFYESSLNLLKKTYVERERIALNEEYQTTDDPARKSEIIKMIARLNGESRN